jgi:Flp pilus assembly protein TadG
MLLEEMQGMEVIRFVETGQRKMGDASQPGRNARRLRQPGMTTRQRRGGSVIFLIAAALVALCGFCALGVDYGRSVLVRNEVQRACDAAALAGARYLPFEPNVAKQAAVYVAWQNGKAVIDPNTIQFFNNNTRIRVRATKEARYTFAPLMNILSSNIAARATAAAQQRANFPPNLVVPMGITPSTYEANKDGSPVVIEGIRQNKQYLGTNDFVLFDLRDTQTSKSNSHMENQLQWGSNFKEVTEIEKTETTLNAGGPAQVMQFAAGMQSRLTAAAGAPWYDDGTKFTDIPAGSPRLIYMIITPQDQPVNGSNNAVVQGFVPVYVQSLTVSGDTMRLVVRMLPMTTGEGGEYVDARNNRDAEGLRIIRLID